MNQIQCKLVRMDAEAEATMMMPELPQANDAIRTELDGFGGVFVVSHREFQMGRHPKVFVFAKPEDQEKIPEKLDPDPTVNDWQLRCDGYVEESDTRVRAWVKPGAAYGQWKVQVSGELMPVVRVERRRDGGTTILHLLKGEAEYRLVFPRRMGSEDRTPRFNGRKVEPK